MSGQAPVSTDNAESTIPVRRYRLPAPVKLFRSLRFPPQSERVLRICTAATLYNYAEVGEVPQVNKTAGIRIGFLVKPNEGDELEMLLKVTY
jgi:hypothetical protein